MINNPQTIRVIKSPWKAVNPPEAFSLKVDSSKARNLLGWSTKLPVSQALAWVVEWYQGYLNQQDMRQLSKRQIQRYEALNSP